MASVSKFKRLSRIANVLFQEGLGYAVQILNLKYHLKFPRKLVPLRHKEPENLAVRLRHVLEDLGGLYVKLGQFLSIRPDLVPREFCQEFSLLQDSVRPVPFPAVKEIIEHELGKPLEELFSKFEKKPLGAASIAQVHRASLKNGRKVVVKVQRPRVKALFETDTAILYMLARRLQKHRLEGFRPLDIVKEFEEYTKNELNFQYELNNLSLFSKIFRNSKYVLVPRPHPALSSDRVIVMDYIDGVKVRDAQGKRFNRKLLAKRLADAMFRQVFEADVFHADLHPGNVLVCKGGKLGLLDFGIVGSLGGEIKKSAMAFYVALCKRDVEEIVRLLLRVGEAGPKTDIVKFKRDAQRIVNEWYFQPKQVRFTHTMHKMFNCALDNGVAMPVDFLLLGKALVTAEGTTLLLDPSFDLGEEGHKHVKALINKRFKRMLSKDYWVGTTKKTQDFLQEVSAQTLAVLDKVRRGELRVDVDDSDVKHLSLELDRSSNRVGYGLIISAFLISAAMLIDFSPKYLEISVFSLVFFILAGMFMLSFLVSVMREGRMRY